VVRADLRLPERLSEYPSNEAIGALLGPLAIPSARLLCTPHTYLRSVARRDPPVALPSVWIGGSATPPETRWKSVVAWGRDTMRRIAETPTVPDRTVVALATLYRMWLSANALDEQHTSLAMAAVIEAVTTHPVCVPSISRLLPAWLYGCPERYFLDLCGALPMAANSVCADGTPVSHRAYVMLLGVVRIPVSHALFARDSASIARAASRITRALEMDARSRACIRLRRAAMPAAHAQFDRDIEVPPLPAVCVLASVAHEVCGFDGGDAPASFGCRFVPSAAPSRKLDEHVRAFEWARTAHAALCGEPGALATCEQWCADLLASRPEALVLAIHRLWVHIVARNSSFLAIQTLWTSDWPDLARLVDSAPCGHASDCACRACDAMRAAIAGKSVNLIATYEHPVAPWARLLRDLRDCDRVPASAPPVSLLHRNALRVVLDHAHLIRASGLAPSHPGVYRLAQDAAHATVQVVGALAGVADADVGVVQAWMRRYFAPPALRATLVTVDVGTLGTQAACVFGALAHVGIEWQRVFSAPLPGDVLEAQVNAQRSRYTRLAAFLPPGLRSLARTPQGADLVWWCSRDPTSEHALGRMVVPIPPAVDISLRHPEMMVCATVARSLEGSTHTVVVESSTCISLCGVCIDAQAHQRTRRGDAADEDDGEGVREAQARPRHWQEMRMSSASAIGRLVAVAGRMVTVCASLTCGAMMELSLSRSVFVVGFGWVCTACAVALSTGHRKRANEAAKVKRGAAKSSSSAATSQDDHAPPAHPQHRCAHDDDDDSADDDEKEEDDGAGVGRATGH